MSITTTAGRSFLVNSTAWRPVCASPTHLQIVFGLQQLPKALADNHVIFRQQDGDAFHKHYFPLPFVTGIWHADGGAFAGRRFDVKAAADHLDPFAHAEQPQSLVPLGLQYAIHLEGFAVVLDLHANAVRKFLDAHVHHAGLRMAGDIGQRFLGDAIEHRALDIIQLFQPPAKIVK